MYKPPRGPIYYDFRSFLKAQQKLITIYYNHIEVILSQPIYDESGDITEQTIWDRNRDEIDTSYDYETIRLYEAFQYTEFRDM